ncbi:antirestriction protein [Escherichia coli]|nr:antirestriction protein [Escherichia coli]
MCPYYVGRITCRTENYAMTVHYYRLRDYALQHPECSAIMRIID